MQFEFSGQRELYLEIADRYKNYIERGILSDGEKLPSVRSAAVELGVNPNTVQRAYSLLESEGYIKSLPKKGAYVSYSESPQVDILHVPDCRDLLRQMKNDGISKEELLRQIEEVYANE